MIYIDLFSGCGGLALGLHNAGWKGLFAVEKSKDAFATLEHNLINKNSNFTWPNWLDKKNHDINNIIEKHQENLKSLRGKVSLVAGGPPCQGFSMAGKRNPDDLRNQLVRSYISILKQVQPKYFVMENVTGILSAKFSIYQGQTQSYENELVTKVLLKEFAEIGYENVVIKTLDTSDYGVPQRRKRVIFLGTRDDINIQLVHPEPLKSQKITARNALSDLENIEIGSKIEEFNFWLNLHEHKFGFKEPNNNDIFFNFMEEYTEWNFCDCCLMIEKSDDLTWTDGQFFDDEKDAINFVNASYSNFAAICQNCLNKFISRTKLSLHEIVQRIKENKMIFRIGDFVILKNKDLILNNMFGYIESLDETTQTYKLKEFENVVIKEEDLFDVANEAYIIEYNKFIENNHVEKVDDLSDFANDNKEHTIDMLVENFGFKDEFIKHLKANDLPYERFVVKSEVTINELDETLVVKNELLEYIFCPDDDNGIVIPTYKELTEVDEYQSNWKLSEEYGDYSLSTLVYLVNEESSKFFNIQKVLNGHKEKFRKSKKYGFRETVEFGAPIEIIKVLQNLHEIDSEKELDGTEMVFLQANISTQDYSTIEVVLQCDINEKELLDYLKSNVEKEHHDEVDKLLEAIKEAKADKHDSLHVYDC